MYVINEESNVCNVLSLNEVDNFLSLFPISFPQITREEISLQTGHDDFKRRCSAAQCFLKPRLLRRTEQCLLGIPQTFLICEELFDGSAHWRNEGISICIAQLCRAATLRQNWERADLWYRGVAVLSKGEVEDLQIGTDLEAPEIPQTVPLVPSMCLYCAG